MRDSGQALVYKECENSFIYLMNIYFVAERSPQCSKERNR